MRSGVVTLVLLLGAQSASAGASPVVPTGLPNGEPNQRTDDVTRMSLSEFRRLSNKDAGFASSLDVLGKSSDRQSVLLNIPKSMRAQLVRMGIAAEIGMGDVFQVSQALDGYLNPEQVVARLQELSSAHPDFMRLETIGTTHEGRPIVGVVIEKQDGLGSQGNGSAKPTVFFNGMHHAREVMTVEVVISIVQSFADALSIPKADPELVDWANRYRIVVVPQMNPDGNNLVHNGKNMWRKNAWTDNGKVVGVDLNRNYPKYWGACNGSSSMKGSDTYRGPSAASEPESQALMASVEKFRPVLGISYHSFSELIIFPFGCSNVENPSRNVFLEIAGGMNKGILNDDGVANRYDVGTAPELLYNADGSDLDWQWDRFGVYAYTIEVNSSSLGFQPDYNGWRDVTVKNQSGGWRAQIRRLGGSGFSGTLDLEGYNALSNWENITYTIEALAPTGKWEAFAYAVDAYQAVSAGSTGRKGHDQSLVNKHFPLRAADGDFFQLVASGRYRVTFWNDKRLLTTKEFDVGQRHLALGRF
jgi:carboxypeptidase T